MYILEKKKLKIPSTIVQFNSFDYPILIESLWELSTDYFSVIFLKITVNLKKLYKTAQITGSVSTYYTSIVNLIKTLGPLQYFGYTYEN